MESILNSIKKFLGIPAEVNVFDIDIILHINSVFMILNQISVGPKNVFSITDDTAVWSDFIPEEDPNHSIVKSYMYLKVRLLFDPPSSSIIMAAMNNMISEFEFRMNAESESGRKEVNQDEEY